MKIKAFVFSLTAAAVIFGLGSCLSVKVTNNKYSSRTNYDWEGTYAGRHQAGGENGLDVIVKIDKDQRFEMYYEYVDKSRDPFSWIGTFKWDKTGTIILVDIIDAPVQYKVEKDKLLRLDLGVNNYTLYKIR